MGNFEVSDIMKLIDMSRSFLKLLLSKITRKRRRKTVGGLKKEIYSKAMNLIVHYDDHSTGFGQYAFIDPSAVIDPSASIDAGVFIGKNVHIGANTRICPNVTILNDVVIRDSVLINPGAVIGTDGYGYYKERKTGDIKHVPQIGNVVIESNVEIGANSCIDRASVGSTIIGRDTKIGNLVQIAHKVKIGKGCLIMSCTSIAGSTIIGDNVVINPQVSISKHVTVGDNAEIGMNSTVIRDVKSGLRVVGSPAKEK